MPKGRQITWDNFKDIVLENLMCKNSTRTRAKVFPINVRNKKEMEFLELKRAVQCVNFINVLHLEIKQAINYHEIQLGQELHNYKSVGLVKDKKFGAQNRTKPYLALVNQPNHHYNSQKTTINHPSGGGSVGSALSTPWRCRKCGCTNHATWDFKDKEVTCFNCGNHSATHSFVSYACVKKLHLLVSSLLFNLVANMPTSGPVTSFNVCLNCPVMIFIGNF
ncbi:hypothetical protein HKD37_01G000959 [Glycine soja]